MIRLFARIYNQTNYQTNYRSLPKFVPDGWSVSSINRANKHFTTDFPTRADTQNFSKKEKVLNVSGALQKLW